MQHSQAFLEKKFDHLYAEASAALKKHDPCQVRGGACLSMREYPENHVNEPFCCTGCKHLGPGGCTVESLHCKLWTCMPIDNVNISRRQGQRVLTPLFTRLKKLREEGRKYHFLIWRGTREESIQKALKAQRV